MAHTSAEGAKQTWQFIQIHERSFLCKTYYAWIKFFHKLAAKLKQKLKQCWRFLFYYIKQKYTFMLCFVIVIWSFKELIFENYHQFGIRCFDDILIIYFFRSFQRMDKRKIILNSPFWSIKKVIRLWKRFHKQPKLVQSRAVDIYCCQDKGLWGKGVYIV